MLLPEYEGAMKQLQILLPPVYLLLSLALMGILDRYLPLMILLEKPWTYLGFAVLIAGLALIIACAILFRQADTPIIPFKHSTALLTDGIYRYSRNPMYLGMLVMLFGAGAAFGSLGPLLVPPLFFFIIREGYIKYEETMLEDIFGDRYRAYTARVRRWL
jgi:protein-S-isoprenylcysteine O-methyltransferase Ste14